MGLDMYLTKETYIGAEYKHRNVKGTIKLTISGKKVNIDVNKVASIVESVGYWRKANAIHNWFVTNVQDGEDDCKKVNVSYDDLLSLKNLCEQVLETKDATPLPPTEGFFFGSTEVDESYFDDLKATVEIINNLDPDGDYYYQSSW